jgi:hypothetical protein
LLLLLLLLVVVVVVVAVVMAAVAVVVVVVVEVVAAATFRGWAGKWIPPEEKRKRVKVVKNVGNAWIARTNNVTLVNRRPGKDTVKWEIKTLKKRLWIERG